MSSDLPPEALSDLPVFPLPRVAIFPRAILRLHVFEPRYRALLADCMASHRTMAIASIVEPVVEEGGHPRIAAIAGVGVVVEHEALPDGRSNIALHGRGRVRLAELPFVAPYRRARATLLDDTRSAVTETARASMLAAATAFAGEVARRNPRFSFQLPTGIDAAAMADLCAHHLVVDADERQSMLEQLDVAERVRMVIATLMAQHGALAREGGRGRN